MKKSRDFTKLYKVGDRVVVNNPTIVMEDAVATVTEVYSYCIRVKYDIKSPNTGSWFDSWSTPEYVKPYWIMRTKLFKALR